MITTGKEILIRRQIKIQISGFRNNKYKFFHKTVIIMLCCFREKHMSGKYIQLANMLRTRAIRAEESGENRLPTEMEIASEYMVSRQTVRSALRVLEEEGLIEKRQGSGSYIRPRKSESPSRHIAVIATFIDDYIFPSILHDVQNIFAKNGFSTLIYITENSVGKERKILEELAESNIDAILIEGARTALPTPNGKLFEAFRKKGIPILFFHGIYRNISSFPSVLDDNEGGGYMLGRYLTGKGHREIAGIFKSDDSQGEERYLGLVKAMTDAGMEINDSRFSWYDTEDRKSIMNGNGYGRDRLMSFIDQIHNEVTAIACYNDEIAYNLIRILTGRGIRVPEDIAVVSFDNSFYSQISPIPITSLGHRKSRIGMVAAELLIDMIRGNTVQSAVLSWDLTVRISG